MSSKIRHDIRLSSVTLHWKLRSKPSSSYKQHIYTKTLACRIEIAMSPWRSVGLLHGGRSCATVLSNLLDSRCHLGNRAIICCLGNSRLGDNCLTWWLFPVKDKRFNINLKQKDKCVNYSCNVYSDVVKDLRFKDKDLRLEDKDLWSEDKDKDLKSKDKDL